MYNIYKMTKSKISLKVKIKSKIKNNILIKQLLKVDVDWIFIMLLTFGIADWNLWERVLFSIGASYVFKMIIAHLRTMRVM